MKKIIITLIILYLLSCSNVSPTSSVGVDDASNFLSGVIVYQNGDVSTNDESLNSVNLSKTIISEKSKHLYNEVASNEEVIARVIKLDTSGYVVTYSTTTTTDENGYYEFKNLPAGEYQVSCKSKKYNNKVVMMKNIKLEKGLSFSTDTLFINNGITVVGNVITDMGLKIVLPGISQRYMHSSGTYSFTGVPFGKYELVFIKNMTLTYLKFEVNAESSDTLFLNDISIIKEGSVVNREKYKDTISVTQKIKIIDGDTVNYLDTLMVKDTVNFSDTLDQKNINNPDSIPKSGDVDSTSTPQNDSFQEKNNIDSSTIPLENHGGF